MIKFIVATPDDIPVIQRLAHEIWYAYYPSIISLEQIAYMLDWMYSSQTIEREMADDYQWRLLQQKNEPIGFISYHFEKPVQEVKLNKIYVLPAFHGQGIGKQALQYVIEQAKEMGATAVYLTVNKKNHRAIEVYLRFGFFIERSENFDIGQGFFMDDYIMRLNLR
ncbi:MAG: GNAT family N-acetyltransferase [Bacteroidales bacterium]